MNKEFLKMQKLAGLITESKYKELIKKENMDDWGNEKDDYGRSEQDYRQKPSLADFDYNEEEYKKYMEEHFPEEPLDEMELYKEGDDIFRVIDLEIITPDQEEYNSKYGEGDEESNYGIGFSTNLSKNKKGKLDYTEEQKINFLKYLKEKVDKGDKKAETIYNIAKTLPEVQDYL